jgi:threonyl-tRNA synthetase
MFEDHKILGKKLDLFYIDEEIGKGLPIWLPKGAAIRKVLESYIVDLEGKAGFQHVYSPHIAKINLYQKSGHLDSYKDAIYPSFGIDEEQYVLRPMNCPHHIQIYKHVPRSYRELPLRLAELGSVYRYEPSGSLAGLIRVRGFVQNDAHIFCSENQVQDEILSCVQMIAQVYKDFKIKDYVFRLSLRAKRGKYAGSQAMWNKAEGALRSALDVFGHPYQSVPGEAAFYGPKLDVQLQDHSGKEFSASSVQLDFLLPQRFGLRYINSNGKINKPVMIHRAPLGSLERFMAFLIEYYSGAFPLWLAPIQIKIIPVSEHYDRYAKNQIKAFQEAGIRAEVCLENGPLAGRVRDAELQKIPVIGVVGKREENSGQINLRFRNNPKQQSYSLDVAIQELQGMVSKKS